MTLSLTVGTNTYISLADAETYMERRYDPSGLWTAASNAVKNQLLAYATLRIDALPWRQRKTDLDQTLEFPRGGDEDIPTAVANACVEEALAALLAGCATDQADALGGLQSASIGGLSESYRAGGAAGICPAARRLLGFWWVGGAAIV